MRGRHRYLGGRGFSLGQRGPVGRWIIVLAVAFSCLLPTGAAQAGIQYVGEWGGPGSGPGQFNNPAGLAVDSAGNVYVADQNGNRVEKFSADGAFLGQFGAPGTGDGALLAPSAVRVDPGGDVFVTDSGNGRIVHFDSRGNLIGATLRGAFTQTLAGITRDPSGYTYVTNAPHDVMHPAYPGDLVQKFDPKGALVAQWGGPGDASIQLSFPVGIAIDPSNYLYVADRDHWRIAKFTYYGALVGVWGGPPAGATAGLLKGPTDVSICGSGDNFVADANHDRIAVFTAGGQPVEVYGSSGSGPGQFDYPRGVVADCRAGQPGFLYVSDHFNNRVQKFAISEPSHGGPQAAPPPPANGVSANTTPVAGSVSVTLPSSAQAGPLTQTVQIPTDSVIDARHGTVRLTMAGAASGGAIGGEFSRGQFLVKQDASTSLPDLSLEGPLTCIRSLGGPRVKAHRSRSLLANLDGRFLARGRYSIAIAQGARFLVTDSCGATLTVVKHGTVVVRDLRKNKFVTLKSGQHYVARRGNR